ncbi:MAG: phage/plasmid primase, P4 family, partial [Xanthomonadales bacterium]|jgi:putative DNA primase/helicase|nr:phage/plasmid primase, P4 family [Xanthomonadales bacterium]
MGSRLSAIEKRQVFEVIKRNTGLPLTTLRQAIAEKSTSEDVPPIEYARKALEQYGEGNIVHALDAFWRYPGRGVWIEEHPGGVKQKIHAVIPDDELSGTAVDGVFKLARTAAFDAGAKFGEPFEGVNVRNGLLIHDGQRWELQPHRKDLFLLAQSPVVYDPTADCPRFKQFLAEIFDGDPDANEKALLLLQLIGYTLLPLSRFEKFALLIGKGANGKSVLLEVLMALLGFDSVAGVAPDKLNDKFQRAYLHGKLANIVTEIEEGAVIADAALKAITSGELTTAEHKYRNPFSFKPVSTCWFATNHMPHTRDFSDALFRRACLLTFNNKFEGERCDPHLKGRLLTELPGILNLALDAIGRVLAGDEFAEPASMMEARREWRLEADQVLQFVEECCHVGRGEIQKGILYRDYKDWAVDAGIHRTLAQKTFTNRLLMAGIGERRDQHARFYVGISLRTMTQ